MESNSSTIMYGPLSNYKQLFTGNLKFLCRKNLYSSKKCSNFASKIVKTKFLQILIAAYEKIFYFNFIYIYRSNNDIRNDG